METADSEVGIGNEEFANKVKELELKLEGLTAELTSEREKVCISYGFMVVLSVRLLGL